MTPPATPTRRLRRGAKAPPARVRAGRRRVELTNPGKVLFPDDGITKADLVDYYVAVAPAMVPHTRGRPAMLHRFPDGIRRFGFYQKDVSGHFPDWVPRVEVAKKGGTVVHPCADDAASLAYLAGQGTVAFHVWTSRADRLDRPDQLIFDLDPSGGEWEAVVETAVVLRELLDDLGLAAYVKTTGSRGLHVVSPLRRDAGFDEVRAFARDVARVVVRLDPDRLTVEARKRDRGGRVYVDVLRNGYAQTAVAPYSVRALSGAPVAAPLDWAELDDPGFGPQRWTIADMAQRLAAGGDPWAGMSRHARSLGRPRRRLDRLTRSSGKNG